MNLSVSDFLLILPMEWHATLRFFRGLKDKWKISTPPKKCLSIDAFHYHVLYYFDNALLYRPGVIL